MSNLKMDDKLLVKNTIRPNLYKMVGLEGRSFIHVKSPQNPPLPLILIELVILLLLLL